MALISLATKYKAGTGDNPLSVQTGPPGGNTSPSTPSQPSIDQPNRITLGMWSEDNAVTFTAFVSHDGQKWIPATQRYTGAKISVTVGAGGDGLALEIVPAPWVKVVMSAAATVDVWVNTTN